MCVCWGLKTRQPLWVILCRLPENGRREIEEVVDEMKEMNRGDRHKGDLIELGFNDTSTLVGHFVSSPREREKEIEEIVEEMKERDREERRRGVKKEKK